MKYEDRNIHSVGEFIIELQNTAKDILVWFRGQTNIEWPLLPFIMANALVSVERDRLDLAALLGRMLAFGFSSQISRGSAYPTRHTPELLRVRGEGLLVCHAAGVGAQRHAVKARDHMDTGVEDGLAAGGFVALLDGDAADAEGGPCFNGRYGPVLPKEPRERLSCTNSQRLASERSLDWTMRSGFRRTWSRCNLSATRPSVAGSHRNLPGFGKTCLPAQRFWGPDPD